MGAPLSFGCPPLGEAQTLALAPWPAAAGLRRIEFLSDLHLAAERPLTLRALAAYLERSEADAIVILGDLFEVWVGDDARDEDHAFACIDLLRAAAQKRPMGCMVGNRDFLLGPGFLQATGMTGLADATLCELGPHRVLLTHGDALCLEDRPYLAFRREVRDPAWQAAFLARPLAERHAIAARMRAASQERKRHEGFEGYGDVDAEAARACLAQAGAGVLLHGHTHRPGRHDLGGGLQRWVLSDWEFDEPGTPRGDIIRLDAAGLSRHLVQPDGSLRAAP